MTVVVFRWYLTYALLTNSILETTKRADRPTTAAAGLIGSSLVGAAAVMGGAMDNLLSGNSNSSQEQARRASAPGTSSNTSGGFSSIFNLKSVINAATKAAPNPQPTPCTSNFYVSSPPVEPICVDLHSPHHTAAPQKTVLGTVKRLPGLRSFLFPLFWLFVCLLMKYCFN